MTNLNSVNQQAISLRDNHIDFNGMDALIIKDDGNTPFKFLPSTRTGKHLIRTDLDINTGDIIETNYFGNEVKHFRVKVTKRLIEECFCYIELEKA